jgi:predicted nucleic acid-binding protein
MPEAGIENNKIITEITTESGQNVIITVGIVSEETHVINLQPSIEERIQDIKNTLDILLLKQEGIL